VASSASCGLADTAGDGTSQAPISRTPARLTRSAIVDTRGSVGAHLGRGWAVFERVRHGIERLAEGPRDAGRAIWDADPGTTGRSLLVEGARVSTETPPGDVAGDLGLEADARTVVRRRGYVLDGKPVRFRRPISPPTSPAEPPSSRKIPGQGVRMRVLRMWANPRSGFKRTSRRVCRHWPNRKDCSSQPVPRCYPFGA
jgi:hypothetical protein